MDKADLTWRIRIDGRFYKFLYNKFKTRRKWLSEAKLINIEPYLTKNNTETWDRNLHEYKNAKSRQQKFIE